MATTKDSGQPQPTKDKELESLRIKLQQIAAFANKNTEQFESQKKQFFEHFSQVFGTPTSIRNAAKNKSNSSSTTPPKSTTPKILSPSIDSPNNNNRTPASSIPNINATPTRFDIRPLIMKQNSFSAKSDSNGGGNGSVSNPNPNLLNGILVVNDFTKTNNAVNNINTNLSAINNNTAINNKATPISLPLNLTPIQNVTNPSSVFSPGATNMLGNIPQLSVPLSMVSNGSHASSAVYQYPYITDPNLTIPPTPNLGANTTQTTLNTLPSLNALNTASLSSQYVAQKTPVSTQPNLTAMRSNYSNTSNTSTSSYESFWIRRVLSNILLLFFRYHPNGVLECELSQFYQQMFHEPLQLNSDLKYLLCVHKSIEITRTKERGQLFTLKDDQIGQFLQEFDSRILQQWIIKHIRRLFRCFPNGIATNCLQDLLYNMVEFKLDDIMGPKWHEFVCNIPTMYCININGLNIFICIELDTLNEKYKKLNLSNTQNNINTNIITANNIQYYLSNYLNQKNILKRPVGYCELLIVLLSNYYSTDPNNIYYKGIDGETLEKAFHQQYQSRLVHEAPFIQHVLGKICNVTVVSKGNDQTKLYKLNVSSKQYFDTQPDAFAPILNRSLELISNNNNTNNVSSSSSSMLPPPKTPHNTQQNTPNRPQRAQRQTNDTNNDDEDNADVPQSPFKEDHVSVFMGGFSHGTTVEVLRSHLAKLGITMISSSGISYRNYGWSFVTLSNAKEAQYLVSISPIQIMGRPIDIRPFINRQRVRNHISNKPTDDAMLHAMIELLQTRPQGLTVADIQLRLFNKFSYRIDGPELTKIVGDNPKHLYIKRQGTERIFATPKLANGITMDELTMKVSKLWKHIACNYRGNIYGVGHGNGGFNEIGHGMNMNMNVGGDTKEEPEGELDKNVDAESTKSSKSGNNRTRTKRKTSSNKYRKVVTSPNGSMISSPTSPRSPASPLSPGSSQNGMPSFRMQNDADYTISVHDFENEFARRYRFAVKPENFGFGSTKELLNALKSQQNLPFNVIEYEFPPQPPPNYFMQQQQQQNGHNNNYRDRRNTSYIPRNHNRGFNKNKNNLNINVNMQNNSNSNNNNITSPRYGINSPSNYSNRSLSGHRNNNNNNNQNQQNVSSPLPQTQMTQNNSSDSKYGFDATYKPQTSLTFTNSNSSQQSLKSPPVATNSQYQSFNATAKQLLNNNKNATTSTIPNAANYPRYVPLPQPVVPYNIAAAAAGGSVSNYGVIPSVPNSLIAGSAQSQSNAAVNLNTINMNINMMNMQKNPYSLQNMQNLNAAAVPNANVSNNSTSK